MLCRGAGGGGKGVCYQTTSSPRDIQICWEATILGFRVQDLKFRAPRTVLPARNPERAFLVRSCLWRGV